MEALSYSNAKLLVVDKNLQATMVKNQVPVLKLLKPTELTEMTSWTQSSNRNFMLFSM